jgi:hypothetical protein
MAWGNRDPLIVPNGRWQMLSISRSLRARRAAAEPRMTEGGTADD